eukprot:scaffold5797_cov115-Isochrysis_galbana.AAC.1
MPELLEHLHLQMQIFQCRQLFFGEHVGTDRLARHHSATPKCLVDHAEAAGADLPEQLQFVGVYLERVRAEPRLRGWLALVQVQGMYGGCADNLRPEEFCFALALEHIYGTVLLRGTPRG